MRSRRRRMPVDHVLIAGQANDVPCMRAALAMLPANAYGQVFVEAPADTPLDLVAPTRVSIQRVDEGCLAGAMTGWIAEWVPAEIDPDRITSMWIGSHAISEVGSTYQHLEGLVGRL